MKQRMQFSHEDLLELERGTEFEIPLAGGNCVVVYYVDDRAPNRPRAARNGAGPEMLAPRSPKKRRQFPLAFKRRIVKLVKAPGAVSAQIARAHGLNRNVVRRWAQGKDLNRMGAQKKKG